MDFQVLGPLEVRKDGRRVAVGGMQAERMLAALLLAQPRVVPLDDLVAALWDGEPPASAKHQVHKTVGRLRAQLGDLIQTDGPGYRIALGSSTFDLASFVEAAAVRTIPSLGAALALWRGPALSGLTGRVLRAAADALGQQRLDAFESLMDLRLAAGQAAAVTAQLPPMIAAHPFREGLRSRLMLALHRCGRRADALAVYAEARGLLAGELGVEPGPELVRAHQLVLTGAATRPGPAAQGPCTLPYDLPDFLGRAGYLERLHTTATTVVITAIDGMAGVGKTALAVHAAYRLAGRYPDGQLFCDLQGHTPGAPPVGPAAALELLLRMLGVAPDDIPDTLDARTARWRAAVSGRRLLVVLDNAANAAQVRPLLPGAPGCLVLVTSRRRLGVLDGATVLSLDVLPDAEAVELLAAVAGPARVAAERSAAAEVVAACANLPLAIRVAGTRLAHRPSWTVRSLAERLRDQRGRLGELTVQDRGVRSAFALSCADLPEAQLRLFRLLGLHPGADFDAHSVAALAGVPVTDAGRLLEGLLDAHLLQQPAAADRYAMHDLVRAYAQELAQDEGTQPRARLYDYFLAAATAATDLINRDVRRFEPAVRHRPAHLPELSCVDDALTWLAAEHRTLVAVALGSHDWQLACVLRAYFEFRGHFADWQYTHDHALGAVPEGDVGRTLLHLNLGALAMWTGDLEQCMEQFRAALAGPIPDPRLEASVLTSLGMVAHLRDRDAEAAGYLRRALAIEHDDVRTRAMGQNNLGLALGRSGHPAQALELHRRALATARTIGSTTAERSILLGLGETSLRVGAPAEEPFRDALVLARAGHFRMHEGLALDGLAHATGDTGFWRQALVIYADLGVERADTVRRHLANVGEACCDLCRAPIDARQRSR